MTATTAPSAAAEANAGRSKKWAQPMTLKGVPNLYKVDENFYRSAQPTRSGFEALAADPGVKTVLNLRTFHRDDKLVAGLDMALVRIPIRTWHIELEDVAAALKAIRDGRKRGPVLLHCQHGADRTGLIVALYRILYQGWSKEEALKEMKQGDFGYHAMWTNISAYLQRVDIPALRTIVETP
jgi:protein tyrosine/serine phosphatase